MEAFLTVTWWLGRGVQVRHQFDTEQPTLLDLEVSCVHFTKKLDTTGAQYSIPRCYSDTWLAKNAVMFDI